jgi:transposase
MLQITAQMTLYLSINFADFRKGIDGLIALCRQQLHQDPFSGALFVFANRDRTGIKLLAYDGNGFWLCQKRFSKGKLKWWPTSKQGESTYHIDATKLAILISQGNPENVFVGPAWKRLTSQPVRS